MSSFHRLHEYMKHSPEGAAHFPQEWNIRFLYESWFVRHRTSSRQFGFRILPETERTIIFERNQSFVHSDPSYLFQMVQISEMNAINFFFWKNYEEIQIHNFKTPNILSRFERYQYLHFLV